MDNNTELPVRFFRHEATISGDGRTVSVNFVSKEIDYEGLKDLIRLVAELPYGRITDLRTVELDGDKQPIERPALSAKSLARLPKRVRETRRLSSTQYNDYRLDPAANPEPVPEERAKRERLAAEILALRVSYDHTYLTDAERQARCDRFAGMAETETLATATLPERVQFTQGLMPDGRVIDLWGRTELEKEVAAEIEFREARALGKGVPPYRRDENQPVYPSGGATATLAKKHTLKFADGSWGVFYGDIDEPLRPEAKDGSYATWIADRRPRLIERYGAPDPHDKAPLNLHIPVYDVEARMQLKPAPHEPYPDWCSDLDIAGEQL